MVDTTGKTTLTRWYVARTEPGREHLAVSGLIRQHIEPYCPRIYASRRCGHRFRNVLKAMLPGYCFVPLPICCEPWDAIRHIHGIMEHHPFLTCDGRPKSISQALIDIVHTVEDREQGKLSESQFQSIYVGKRIMITVQDRHGVVSEFKGIVENIAKLDTQGRIRVIAEWLGGSRQVEVRVAQIKAEGLYQAETTH